MFQNLKEPSWPSKWRERWLTQERSKIRGEGGYLTGYSKIRRRWLPHKMLTDQEGWLPHKVLTDKGRLATPKDTDKGRVSTSQDTHRSGEVGYLEGDKIRGTYFQREDRVHEDQLQAPSRHPCGRSLSVSLCLWTTIVGVGSP